MQQQISQMGEVEDVEDMLADMDEHMGDIDQIGEALAQDMTHGGAFDDGELLQELDQLELGDADAQFKDFEAELLGGVGGTTGPQAVAPQLPDMPVAPVTMPVVPTREPVQEEDEFASLEADMMI